jgi:His-Xaa-Ser system radical SAM maturase HxsC
MLTLGGVILETNAGKHGGKRQLLSLSTDPDLPTPIRAQKAFLISNGGELPSGFCHYIAFGAKPERFPNDATYTVLGNEFSYFGDNDVIALGNGRVRSLFRANSVHNSILLTEQCNNYCLMCSQPPKQVDDLWLLEESIELIRLIPRKTVSLGITGGEPTLFGDGLINLLRLSKNWLPHTSLHLLSNGRAFANAYFAEKYAAIDHHDLMVGIPVYSSDPTRHDYVVQARGAFDETIRGILNLKQLNQRVEIRVVIHQQTSQGLPELAEFITRNLLFVDHVSLMGLEMTGFTRANLDALWIDPIDYKAELSKAVQTLSNYGIKTSVYNHPLCLVNRDVEHCYVKSISDWKNEYAVECKGCTRKHACGGLFSSAINYGYSKSITPFL